MKRRDEIRLSPKMQRAIEELERKIKTRYPEATFQVKRNPENPRVIHLMPTVDLIDQDEVLDLVIDRLVDLQVKEHLPLFVVPLRTPEREAEVREDLRREREQRAEAAAGTATA